MKIVSELEFLENLSKEKFVVLSFKYNNILDRCVCVSFKNDDRCFFTKPIEKDFMQHVAAVIYGMHSVVLYDKKVFLRYYYNNNIKIDNYTNIVDIKFEMYKFYCEDIQLDNDIIKSISRIDYSEDKLLRFYKSNSRYCYLPYQCLDEHRLYDYSLKELNILDSMYKFLYDKIEKSTYSDVTYTALQSFSKIESNGIKLNTKNVKFLEKYFDYYIFYKDYSIGYSDYKFNHTITGRLSCKFHTLSKKDNSIIVSRFQNGKILSIDFSSFEIRNVLLLNNIFNMKNNKKTIFVSDDDIYKKISISLTKDEKFRDLVKINIISWLYGAKEFKEKVVRSFLQMYSIQDYLISVKRSVSTNIIKVASGKNIKYTNVKEAKKKCISGEVQNFSVCVFFSIVNKLQNLFEEKNLNSLIIATKYDEIIIDCFENEYDKIISCLEQANVNNEVVQDIYSVRFPFKVSEIVGEHDE